MLAYTDVQTINQVLIAPTLPVCTDVQTVSSLRANFALDNRVFIAATRHRAKGSVPAFDRGLRSPPPAIALARR